jgi:hypothetical protein
LNDPVANIDKDGLASVPLGEVTITAKAIHRMSAFSSFTSRLLGEAGLASEAINLSSLGVHVLQTGGVLGLSWLTRSIGMRAASNLGGPGHWYVNNTTKEISFYNGSGSRAGYKNLGSTYKGYVNNGGKEYGFSGGSNGSVTLSRELPEVKITASQSCEYCLGGAGAYGPWNPNAMGVTIYYGGAMFGGYSFAFSIGFIGNRFGAWVTPAVSGGVFGGTGFSVFASDYVGSAPMNPNSKDYFKSYMKGNYNVNVGAGLNFGYGGDYLRDPLSGKVKLGTTWKSYSIGGLGVGVEGDWGYSIPLFNFKL